MNNYTISRNNIAIRLLLIFAILCGALMITAKDNYWIVIISVLFLIAIDCFFFFGNKFLAKVSISKKTVTLHIVKFFIIKKPYAISTDDLLYSYDLETGAKGSKAEELRFYENGRKVIGVGRGYDGWTKNVIWQIIDDLESVGVKQYRK